MEKFFAFVGQYTNLLNFTLMENAIQLVIMGIHVITSFEYILKLEKMKVIEKEKLDDMNFTMICIGIFCFTLSIANYGLSDGIIVMLIAIACTRMAIFLSGRRKSEIREMIKEKLISK